MDLSVIIIQVLLPLATTGGVIYLIVDKLVTSKQERANIKTQIISDSNEVADLYKKIDEIVESKTAPLREELTNIKEHYCCFRENCHERVMMPPTGLSLREQINDEKCK